ncbi:MAG: DinB family protein [Pseudonocardia sp.]
MLYDDSRRRVCELAASLTEEELDTRVPATPAWTARQVVAHLTGCASDALHGRTEGAPGEAWTARQVADREGRPLAAVVAEWEELGPRAREALEARKLPLRIVIDVLSHEADLREAFGRGPLPEEAVDALLPKMAPAVVGAAGDGALVVRAGTLEMRGGDGEPTTSTSTRTSCSGA